jgi:hypothetical protein
MSPPLQLVMQSWSCHCGQGADASVMRRADASGPGLRRHLLPDVTCTASAAKFWRQLVTPSNLTVPFPSHHQFPCDSAIYSIHLRHIQSSQISYVLRIVDTWTSDKGKAS